MHTCHNVETLSLNLLLTYLQHVLYLKPKLKFPRCYFSSELFLCPMLKQAPQDCFRPAEYCFILKKQYLLAG